MTKIAGSGVGSGSVSQSYGSADPDPDKNVTDTQHWFLETVVRLCAEIDLAQHEELPNMGGET